MKFENLQTIKLLPEWMRDDGADIGLSKATDKTLKELYVLEQVLTKWNRIDKMNDEQLDALAWELNVPWYLSDADLDTKRQVLKESDFVHSKLGTNEAVQRIIDAYFGGGYVLENWEYGGKPYHFKVATENAQKVYENYDIFLILVAIVKRDSAWLDSIILTLKAETHCYWGVCFRDTSNERHYLGPHDLQASYGAVFFSSDHETYRLGIEAYTANVDTGDATATSDDLMNGKVAYARGEQLVGTISAVSDGNMTIPTADQPATLAKGYHDGTGTVSFSDQDKKAFLSSNIRKGVTALGVEGTYLGEPIQTETGKVTPSDVEQTITAQNSDGFSSVTVQPIYYKEQPNDTGTTVIIGKDIEEETNGSAD